MQNEWAVLSPVALMIVAFRPVKGVTGVIIRVFSSGVHHKSR